MVDQVLLERIREYIKRKTGKIYFKNIRTIPNNLIVTCPFHKDGQETKPSAGIRTTEDDFSPIGMLHCFTCGESMMLSEVIKTILGPLYNEDEVETLFQLNLMELQTRINKPKVQNAFKIPAPKHKEETILKQYRYYHPYLETRRISEKVADIYDIGFDKINNQITFPIRDKNRNCIGIGRRHILKKEYKYPARYV